jgi:hypothetical protein
MIIVEKKRAIQVELSDDVVVERKNWVDIVSSELCLSVIQMQLDMYAKAFNWPELSDLT